MSFLARKLLCGGDATINGQRKPGRYQAQAARKLGKPSQWIPDTELIVACLSGKAFAWDALIERYEALIYTLAKRSGLADSDAADVFQEVCVLLFNGLADLRDHTRLPGWLASTTRREAWRLLQRKSPVLASDMADFERQIDAALTAVADSASSPETIVLALEEQHLIGQAIEQLPDSCRRLLTLLYCHQPPCSYAETARQTNLPLGSIGPMRARCLQQLLKILQENGF